MIFYNWVYYSLILCAFIISFIAFVKGYTRAGVLAILLLVTFIVEISVIILYNKKIEFTWIYHLFNLTEYSLFSCYFAQYIPKKQFSKALYISIPLYLAVGLSVSYCFYQFKGFPGINLNIEGLLLSIICIYVLFTIEPEDERSIFLNNNFWICSAVLIFFSCTFFYNGVYTTLNNINEREALKLFSYLHRPLNLVLYSFISIGMLCIYYNRKVSFQ